MKVKIINEAGLFIDTDMSYPEIYAYGEAAVNDWIEAVDHYKAARDRFNAALNARDQFLRDLRQAHVIDYNDFAYFSSEGERINREYDEATKETVRWQGVMVRTKKMLYHVAVLLPSAKWTWYVETDGEIMAYDVTAQLAVPPVSPEKRVEIRPRVLTFEESIQLKKLGYDLFQRPDLT